MSGGAYIILTKVADDLIHHGNNYQSNYRRYLEWLREYSHHSDSKIRLTSKRRPCPSFLITA